MNVFIRAIVKVFSFGERLIVPFNSAVASLNGTIDLSPQENILTIALINIHYLYIVYRYLTNCGLCFTHDHMAQFACNRPTVFIPGPACVITALYCVCATKS